MRETLSFPLAAPNGLTVPSLVRNSSTTNSALRQCSHCRGILYISYNENHKVIIYQEYFGLKEYLFSAKVNNRHNK